MPKVAAPSALRPIATRTPLSAITAVQALCSTINRKLVMPTNHARRLKGCSVEAGAEFGDLLVSKAISVPTYRRTEPLSSNGITLPPALRKFPINHPWNQKEYAAQGHDG